jgi:hypothetical protein
MGNIGFVFQKESKINLANVLSLIHTDLASQIVDRHLLMMFSEVCYVP